jgi:hypothetical protein
MPWCSGGWPGSKLPGSYDRPVLRERYDQYIRRFNAADATAFDDICVACNSLSFTGLDGQVTERGIAH